MEGRARLYGSPSAARVAVKASLCSEMRDQGYCFDEGCPHRDRRSVAGRWCLDVESIGEEKIAETREALRNAVR